MSRTICVKKCPKADNETIECLPTSTVKQCSDLSFYKTTIIFDAFCFPNSKDELAKVASMFSGFNLQSFFQSFSASRYIFIAAIGVAFLLSYLFCYLLDWCTWVIVIVSIVGVFALGIYISILSWLRYAKLRDEPKTEDSKDNLIENANIYKWIAITLWVVLSLLFMTLCCLFDRIILATHIIQAAADFVGDQTAITLVPVLSVVVSFVFFFFWLLGLAAIYSTGEIYHNKDYPWGKIKTDQIKYAHSYQKLPLHPRICFLVDHGFHRGFIQVHPGIFIRNLVLQQGIIQIR